MGLRRHRLSTHLIRRTARDAQNHYETLQVEASGEGPSSEYARKALAHLGIGLTDRIDVERAKYERGKWVVIAS